MTVLTEYTVAVTFEDEADAEQFTRLLIEDGTRVRRKGNVVFETMVLEWPDDDPDKRGKTWLAKFLDQDVEADVWRTFEGDLSDWTRANLPAAYWEVVERRPLSPEETTRYIAEAREAFAVLEDPESPKRLKEKVERIRAENEIIEANRRLLEDLDKEMDG